MTRVATVQPRLAGWGLRYLPGRETLSEDLEAATRGAVLSRGLGRSYGDSSLPASATARVVGTRRADRILRFDADTGRLRVEAGVSLDELVRLFLPRGWFTPVTPGTKFVTVGGMVASDVHGKNHHVAGCFGAHVHELRLRVADDRIVTCSPQVHPDLFWATVGGMGLTGHLLEVEFSLDAVPSPWILQESQRVPDVETFVEQLELSGSRWPFTMGWIDCVSQGRDLGRGILQRGRFAEPSEAPPLPPDPRPKLAVPVLAPGWLLNDWTARVFNGLYYWRHLRERGFQVMHPDAFFYPLDAIHHWNRVYGRRGMTQYQCVLPRKDAGAQARRFLELLTADGGASPLCVIKDCGAEGQGILSFPRPGISIAVDLAVSPRTQATVDRLNEFVIAAGGRIYLTKDGFTRPEHFRAMEPRLPRFQEVRRAWDPQLRLRSAQSVRVLGDPPS